MKYFSRMNALIVAGATMLAAGSASSQDMTKISIAISSASLPAAGARVAEEMGLFEAHGLDADITPMESANIATMAMLSGSVQFSSGTPSDLIVASEQGQDVVELLAIYRGIAGTLVLDKAVAEKTGVLPSAPFEERVRALDGLKLAFPSATATYTVAMRGAQSLGAEIEFSYMAQPAMIAALQTGVIDGFMASAPNWVIPVAQGAAVAWISGPGGDFPPELSPVNTVTLHTSAEYARENPDVVASIRAVFADLAEAFRERPDDVKAAFIRLYPDQPAEILDQFFAAEAPAFAEVQPVTPDDMQREIDFLKMSGSLASDAVFDTQAMIAP